MHRLSEWLRLHLSPFTSHSPASDPSDRAYTQLKEANQLLKRTRATRTGNPVADMVTGTYRPPNRRAGRR